jgi:predicted nucleic acid-binding protein
MMRENKLSLALRFVSDMSCPLSRAASLPSILSRSARLHVPDPRPIRDGLIAATALVHSMTIVTRNVAHFEPTGIPIINPWN